MGTNSMWYFFFFNPVCVLLLIKPNVDPDDSRYYLSGVRVGALKGVLIGSVQWI